MEEKDIKCFYSQLGEDMFLYNLCINQRVPGGRYVEVGAMTGEALSNTKFLQDELGFSGVLIEPNPVNFQYLNKNRPKDAIYPVAIGETFQEKASFCSFSGANTLALSYLKEDTGPILKGTSYLTSGNVIEVPVYPLSDVLADHFNKTCTRSTDGKSLFDAYIDFMSIDVEGAEEGVLKSMDWRIPVGIICIEMHEAHEEKNDNCRNIMKENGFELLKRLHCNEFWVNRSYYRGNLLFKPTGKPPVLGGKMMVSEEHRQEIADVILGYFYS